MSEERNFLTLFGGSMGFSAFRDAAALSTAALIRLLFRSVSSSDRSASFRHLRTSLSRRTQGGSRTSRRNLALFSQRVTSCAVLFRQTIFSILICSSFRNVVSFPLTSTTAPTSISS